ncbi:hypothetical protein VaNZ11_014374 [Volvox africanus]|uniref:Protein DETOXIFICATION n=1 Tax=Volvox africanus TaxID=51714 RepID=A0ABQ5SJ70_9CHLO|nr:hypothetical protein VaNZ11_014374 [Volvox africanus]
MLRPSVNSWFRGNGRMSIAHVNRDPYRARPPLRLWLVANSSSRRPHLRLTLRHTTTAPAAAAHTGSGLPYPGGGTGPHDGEPSDTDQSQLRRSTRIHEIVSNEGPTCSPSHPAAQGRGNISESPLVESRLQSILDIASFALPLATQNVLGYSLNAFSGAIIGRLGPTQLSASTLGNSTYSITGLSLVWGGAAGLETLCGQAHGAGNFRLMRLVLLRAILLSWAVCLPVTVLWLNAESLLVALGQSPSLVAEAASYLKSLVPSLFAYSLSEGLQVYLVVQGCTQVTTTAKAIATALGPLYYWGCMFGLNLGLVGAGYAYALCKATNAAVLLGWMLRRALRRGPPPSRTEVRGQEEATVIGENGGEGQEGLMTTVGRISQQQAATNGSASYGGSYVSDGDSALGGEAAKPDPNLEVLTVPLSAAAATCDFNQQQQQQLVTAAAATSRFAVSGLYRRLRILAELVHSVVAEALDLRACREYVRFAVPAAAMCCLEWWAYEALVIAAGWLPNADMAVGCLGICFTVSGMMYMLPQAIATATCARVSGALGSGDAAAAQRHYQAGCLLVGLMQSALCVCLLASAGRVAAFFCPDPAAAELTASLLPITAIGTLGDGMNALLNNGVLRACGRQALGARLLLLSYWCCGLPGAYFAGFHLGLGVAGFVAAIGITSILQSLVVGILVSRWDWHTEVRKSQAILTNMAPKVSSETGSSNGSHIPAAP